MIVLGIMSGTSVDGIDYVVTKIEGQKQIKIQYLSHQHFSFSKEIQKRVQKAIRNEMNTYDIGLLHHDLGREYAKHFQRLKNKNSIQLIGLHGQTVFHKGKMASLQLGEPSYLSNISQKPVAFNFRALDIATGGEGAPLAPLFHEELLKSWPGANAFHNLGGISNLTYIHGNAKSAFDTGPASTLLDNWISEKTRGRKKYDHNGELSAQGLVHLPSLNKMLRHPFFQKKAPKSCGREEFHLSFVKKYGGSAFDRLSLPDQMATLTELTAVSIRDSYQKFSRTPQKIVFSGGGSKNRFLMQRLKIHLSKSEVLVSEDMGWPSEAIEGGAFALLAYKRHQGLPSQMKGITGTDRRSLLLGQITS